MRRVILKYSGRAQTLQRGLSHKRVTDPFTSWSCHGASVTSRLWSNFYDAHSHTLARTWTLWSLSQSQVIQALQDKTKGGTLCVRLCVLQCERDRNVACVSSYLWLVCLHSPEASACLCHSPRLHRATLLFPRQVPTRPRLPGTFYYPLWLRLIGTEGREFISLKYALFIWSCWVAVKALSRIFPPEVSQTFRPNARLM